MTIETIKPHWTDGLTTRSKNALKGHGFASKNEALCALERNEISRKKAGGGGIVAGLGKKGIAEVQAWLELPSKTEISEKSEIEQAIDCCKRHGYTVTPNAD